MGQDKEKLKKLLQLIGELLKVEGNEWFGLQLLEILSNKDFTSFSSGGRELIGTINQNVDSIHKYLTLDVIPMIDYSSIPDERVKNQLFRDCLEMGKYRLGKINDTINFDEFCKYAHLQAEELLNYYYMIVFGDLSKIIVDIKEYCKFYKEPSKNITSITQIDYTIKLIAFQNKFNLKYKLKEILMKLKNLRNEQSHRATIDQVEEEIIFRDYEKVKDKRLAFMTDIEKETFKKAELIIFRRTSDFDSVYLALDHLKSTVINSI